MELGLLQNAPLLATGRVRAAWHGMTLCASCKKVKAVADPKQPLTQYFNKGFSCSSRCPTWGVFDVLVDPARQCWEGKLELSGDELLLKVLRSQAP